MAIQCPACGEQIVVKRLGFCPGCRAELPPALKLSPEKAEELRQEFEKARRASRGSSDGGGGVYGDFGGFDGGDGGGDCGGGGD